MTATPLLSIRSLGVRFKTRHGELVALDDVSLDVPAGRTIAVVGESGSGKSVLARSILRLLPADCLIGPSASIRFRDTELMRLTQSQLLSIRGRRIAMVFQDPMTSLNPVKTIGAQLTEGLRRHIGLDRSAATRRAIDLLAQVGISSPHKRVEQFPHELSGGMRQRVVIAMAIACEPELLIADEPTTALDVTVQAEILDLLSRLQRERQMAMLLITHDMGVAAGRSDQIVVMYGGQIVEQANTSTLFGSPRMPYTQALLRAIPKLSDAPHSRLNTIPGRPPTIYGAWPGCRFAARCDRRQLRCERQSPTLSVLADGSASRCWLSQETVQ